MNIRSPSAAPAGASSPAALVSPSADFFFPKPSFAPNDFANDVVAFAPATAPLFAALAALPAVAFALPPLVPSFVAAANFSPR